MEMNNQKKNANIGVSVFLFLLALVLLGFSFFRQHQLSNLDKDMSQKISQEVTKEVGKILPQTSNFPDFDSLIDLKKLKVVDNFQSWTPEAQVNEDKTQKTIILDKGTLAKAYVYIRASLNNKALTKWESIYLKMNDTGGHIFRKETLPLPSGDKTELLFALDSIPYLEHGPYSELRVPFHADWFQFFRDKLRLNILTFASSLRPVMIEEISIYYGCIENSDCELKLVK